MILITNSKDYKNVETIEGNIEISRKSLSVKMKC